MRAMQTGLAMMLMVGLWTGAALPFGAARAQGLGAQSFAPVVEVNGRGITGFELAQRAKLISVISRSPDPMKQAETDLIDDRLRMDAAARAGLEVTREMVAKGVEEFAGRANMSADQFLAALAQEGVEAQTLRDFVEAGMAWREVVKANHAGQVRITEAEIDRALSLTAERGRGIRLLVSEFILPIPAGREADAAALAAEVAASNSEAEFAAYARQYSATASREAGGRMPWIALEKLPPVLQPLLLALQPGQTTAPLPLPDAVAVFMLRGMDENGAVETGAQEIEYATYLIPSVSRPEGAAALAAIKANVKICKDLYTINKGQPEALLQIETRPLGDIPTDVALQLAHLDAGEVSAALPRGDKTALVMLCSRTRPDAEAKPEEKAAEKPAEPLSAEAATRAKRRAIRDQLTAERMSKLADADLAELRADAVIRR